MPFDSKQEYLELIPKLAQTEISWEVANDMPFGRATVRFLGSHASVNHLGEVKEGLTVFPQPSFLRRLGERFGFLESECLDRSMFLTPSGQVAAEFHSQTISLGFPSGEEAEFEARRVGSRGFYRLQPGIGVIAVFATTGSDLVLFGVRSGVDWHWVYNDMADRLQAANLCSAYDASRRFQDHADT